jgi:hypothetical protein
MEIIVTLLILGLWILLDKKIEELLSKKSLKLKQIEQILRVDLNIDWSHKRYLRVKYCRWFIILILISENVSHIIFFTIFICLMVYVFPYLKLKQQANRRIQSVRYHFPIYLRQVQVLLQNNTVVKSIELSLDYVPDVLFEDINLLNENIKTDSLNINHYLNCMKQYNLPEIQRSMKWLYRYQNFGYQDAYHQFNRMLVSTSKWLRQARIEKKNESIQVYQWMGMLPLVGVTFVFISAMMSVVISLFERG